MTLTEVLERLEPVQQRAVALVYFEGRSTGDAARLLAVERAVVAAALSAAFRRIARWVMDDDDSTTRFGPSTVARATAAAESRLGGTAREH